MKQHWVFLELRFEAPILVFNLAMASGQAALSGTASLIATFLVVLILFVLLTFSSMQ